MIGEIITITIKTPIRSGAERDQIKRVLKNTLALRFDEDVIEIKSCRRDLGAKR